MSINTAGNITRIVKKSSSNFLKKFVKSFDDKDAPPTPSIPASNNTPPAKQSGNGSRSAVVPEAPTVVSQQMKEQIGGVKSLDTPPPLSPLMDSDLEHRFISMEIPPRPVEVHFLSMGAPEAWISSSAESKGVVQTSSLGGVSAEELADSLTQLSQEQAPLNRRRSKGTDSVNELDDDEEEDEDEDEDLPANISNRLSKLYESGTIHLNQSQTSLYYSTKSNLSDEAAEQASRRESLAQDALGYSLGLSRGNSIRFSQYSLGSVHMAPYPGSHSNPTSPGLNKGFMEHLEVRPVPRRPVSMFVPATSSLDEDDQPVDDSNTSNQQEALSLDKESTPTEQSIAGTPTQSTSNLLLLPGGTREGLRTGSRPVTICFSPEDANKISFTSSTSLSSLLQPDMSAEDQKATTLALAIRSSKRCFDEDATFLKRDEIAEYLGTPKPFNQQVLSHYMNHFNFAGKRLDSAFRALCQKLILKGESQEVDRILEAFAERYVVCNPRSLLGGADHAKDVVHAITYSTLLLNTDLHIVQQSTKMSRSAFVKNTLQVVQSQALQASQSQVDRSEDSSNSFLNSSLGLPRSESGESLPEGMSLPTGSKKRTPSVKSWKSGHSQQTAGFTQALSGQPQAPTSKMGTDAKANGGYGNGKWWQQELEGLLKDIYVAVKANQILLPSTASAIHSPGSKSHLTVSSPPTSPTVSGFGSSIFNSNRMSRLIYPSSSSQHHQDSTGAGSGFGLGLSGRRNSVNARTKQLRNEAIQRLNAQAQSHTMSDSEYLFVSAPSSASSNPNYRYSVVSHLTNDSSLPEFGSSGSNGQYRDPARTPATSRDLSFLHTRGDQSQHSSSSRLSSMTMTTSQTTMSTSTSASTPSASQNSLTSLQSPAIGAFTDQDEYQQQLYKKQYDQHADSQEQRDQLHHRHIQSRYRMEGILWRKHLLERSDKKAQHRAWRQLLVVVDTDQGTLSMFRSDGSLPKPTSSQGQHHQRSAPTPSHHGDYEADVPLFDEIPLQHTITNILPPPGYSSSRRHVFAVQLFTGAVYLFQANNPLECEAWARTCNYWAARTSKEPLVGGVVNMEYGWGRALEALARQEEDQQQLMQSYPPTSNSLEGGRTTPGSDVSTHSSAPGKPVSSSSSRSINGSIDGMPRPKNGKEYASSDIGLGAGSGRGRSASIRSGTRGSVSSGSGVSAPGYGGGVALADSIVLFEWTAPMPAMSVSQLSEDEQMQALRKYVSGLEAEMELHQEHRSPMVRLFLPKSANYAKAFNNWERRSRHLLKEMVKYQIYVECLEQSLQFQHRQQLEYEQMQQAELDRLDEEFDQGQGGYADGQAHQQTLDDVEAELAMLVVHEGPE
ncbi:hypothetical protein BGZ98_001278 [Dissophora globulifera]|nr:hypothetical protein BGZ98_001278 [Dissophora globulifera]